jgi:hypothetical protein
VHVRRKRWIVIAATIGGLTLAAAVSIATRIPITSDALRTRVVRALADRLDADVELDDLTLRIYPRLHATGRGLTVRFQKRRDVPPLVSIDRFSIDADLVGLWRRRVARVRLDGLSISIPPDPDDEPPAGTLAKADAAPASRGPSAETTPPSTPSTPPASSDATDDDTSSYAHDVIIEQLEAPDSQLAILRSDPEKAPRVWYMHQLTMRNVGLASKMPFDTLLTNAVPPGQIAASGTFGPWGRSDPGATPLEGRFTFDNADLSVFNGISGILSARGTFDGTLDRIAVDGETETPDFMVNISHHTVPLRTTYRAIVDATNGNTTLAPVNAVVLNTPIVAQGGVYEIEGVDGREVRLDVTIDGGRLEDVMRMAVNTPRAPMTGGLDLKTALVIPPGRRDVVDKLQLDGQFTIRQGRFTDRDVQAKVNDLSRRARGRKQEDGVEVARVTSNFAGRFKLANGRLGLNSLAFDIPGALVSLNGTYGLKQETIAFAGDLHMDAKVSQTTTGFKSLLLKMADPLFRRNGKTVVPLKISGTRNDPHFGLDMKRVFKR